MVRVAAVRREVEEETTTPDLAGLTPSQQLARSGNGRTSSSRTCTGS